MKRIFGPYPPPPEEPKAERQETAPQDPEPKTEPPRPRPMGALRMATRAHQERLARIQAAQANYREQHKNENAPS